MARNPYNVRIGASAAKGSNVYDSWGKANRKAAKQQQTNKKAEDYVGYAQRAVQSPALGPLLQKLRTQAEDGDKDARARYNAIQNMRGQRTIKGKDQTDLEKALGGLKPQDDMDRATRAQASKQAQGAATNVYDAPRGGAVGGLAGAIAEPLTQSYDYYRKYPARGLASLLNTDEITELRKAETQQQTTVDDILRRLQSGDIDPRIALQLLETLDTDDAEQLRKEIQGETNTRRFLASSGEILLDVATLGTGGAALKGAKGARVAGAGAAEGAGFGLLGSLQSEQAPTLGQAIKSTAVGTALGGALGGLAGYQKPATKTTAKAMDIAGTGDLTSALKTADIDESLRGRLMETFQTGKPVKRKGAQTSRTKQFKEKAERELIEDIEASKIDGVEQSGQVQTQASTLEAAAKRGPIDLTKVQVGQKVDAVDVARARLSMSQYIDNLKDAMSSKKPEAILKAQEELKRAREGYQVITGEAGRALNIQGTFDNRIYDVVAKIDDYMASIPEGKQLSAGQMAELDRIVAESAQELSTTQKIKNKIYAGDTSIVRALEEYATAAKLTSPVTHMRNIIGNTSTFVIRAAEQTLASAVGAARGGTSIKSLKYVLGTTSGYKAGTKKAWDIIKNSLSTRQATDISSKAREGYNQIIPGRAGAIVRLPFTFLEAGDEFGKAILRDSRLYQEATEIAYREGFRGNELNARISELVETPTKPMLDAADADALEYTFQKPLGSVGSAAQKMIQKTPGGRFFVPFIRTPTNIVKFQAERSIIGAPKQLVDAIAKKGTREGDEAIARLALGTTLSLGSAQWVMSNRDRITGAAPSESAARDAFYGEGKQPYSLKIGDRWVSYQNFQPLGLYLLQAKAFDDAIQAEDDDGAATIAASMATTAAQGLLELPFVQGMSEITELLSDPEYNGERFMANLVRGFVPNGLRDIRLYQDEVIRAPENLREQIYDMIPGLSDDIEPRLNVMGEEVKRTGSPAERSFLRIMGTEEQDSSFPLRMIQESEYFPRMYRTQAGKYLNDDEYYEFKKIAGRSLSDAINSNAGRLESASKDDKYDLLAAFAADAREEARETMGIDRD